jgi:hypothetical protein
LRSILILRACQKNSAGTVATKVNKISGLSRSYPNFHLSAATTYRCYAIETLNLNLQKKELLSVQKGTHILWKTLIEEHLNFECEINGMPVSVSGGLRKISILTPRRRMKQKTV